LFFFGLVLARSGLAAEAFRLSPAWICWQIKANEEGFHETKLGRTLCYIYCRDDAKNAEVATVLTWEEGRRVAANIAKLPELLKQ
jgi:hypothetical protein